MALRIEPIDSDRPDFVGQVSGVEIAAGVSETQAA